MAMSADQSRGHPELLGDSRRIIVERSKQVPLLIVFEQSSYFSTDQPPPHKLLSEWPVVTGHLRRRFIKRLSWISGLAPVPAVEDMLGRYPEHFITRAKRVEGYGVIV